MHSYSDFRPQWVSCLSSIRGIMRRKRRRKKRELGDRSGKRLSPLKEVVAKDFECKNGSCCPLRALAFHDSSQSVGDLKDLYGIRDPLKLSLEMELGPDLCLMSPPTADDILLFFKVYDPESEKLRYAGRLFVNHFTKPTHILTKLNELAGFDAHQSIELYEDARKGILFMDFPPVLQLHLKRFEYDIEQGLFVKINDRYEFPIQLDLDKNNRKYLSPEADKTKRNLYTLQSVLVHSGGIDGGHYYVYIRPDLSNNQWYKFDDEKMSRQDVDTTIEGLYGGEQDVMPSYFGMTCMKNSNAYMLVYIRESDKENILCAADEKEIAMPLREKLRREMKEVKDIAQTDAHTIVKVATDDDISQQIGSEIYFDLVDFDKVRGFHAWRFMPLNIFKERLRREMKGVKDFADTDAHNAHTVVKVATDDDISQQIESEIYFDLVDFDKVRGFHVWRFMPLNIFKEVVAKVFGLPPKYMHYWVCAECKNVSCHPLRALAFHDSSESVGDLKDLYGIHDPSKFFLYAELGLDSCFMPLPYITSDDILLFFKVYDSETEKLRYAGRLVGFDAHGVSNFTRLEGFPRCVYIGEIK
ncbi:ubiquitin C-terminal hydrolase 13-like isoform X2 [Andrographis paniculata]|uniref:ubiquitin C-terminal hydrolase 13-like isoform X2 n=1 Tax=Andrographis paniculata TaxID=175694 RepID=UPI0021E82568|nr:ubiquitin C-terminal hydrolase 13-like isoform X2 [Andrographis paniculata]